MPLLVTTFTVPPMVWPLEASISNACTRTSVTASCHRAIGHLIGLSGVRRAIEKNFVPGRRYSANADVVRRAVVEGPHRTRLEVETTPSARLSSIMGVRPLTGISSTSAVVMT